MKAALLLIALAGCSALDYEPNVGALQPPDAPEAPPVDDGGHPITMIGKCEDSDPMVSVSFARDIRPLTQKSPGGCSCHSGNTTAGSAGSRLSNT